MATPIQTELNFLGTITRQEADERGLVRYYTGKPCRNGHDCERFVVSRGCVECLREKYRRRPHIRTPEQKARRAWRSKQWKKDNPELTHVHNLRAKQTRIRNAKEVNRKTILHRQQQQVQMAGRPKPACCETCGRRTRRLCFDHCHQTGRFRGWLCQNCNAAIGMAHDSPAVCRRWAEYLEQNEANAQQAQAAAAQAAQQQDPGNGGEAEAQA